jgi:hypothetical protein
VDVPDTEGRTALMWAAIKGNGRDPLGVLLNLGASPNKPASSTGNTALHFAANEGHAEVVQLLLEEGADAGGEASACEGIGSLAEGALEFGAGAEGTGHGEREDGPEVHEAVFDRSTSEDQPIACIQFTSRFCCLRIRIFDLLTLVKNHRQPLDLIEQFAAYTKLRVVHHQHVQGILEIVLVDVIAVAQVFLRFRKEDLLIEEEIIHV